ncbi:MAG: cache domain-containing protein, partial [Deltaproteobacteria bacterium]|nr:cache domain-containing protein [Deltaproteobacteria bacterium]
MVKSFFPFSIRQSMLLLIFLSVAPPILITIWSGLEQRRLSIVEGEKDVLTMVKQLAIQQEQLTAATRQYLAALAQLPEIRNLNPEACEKTFKEQIQINHQYHTISAADDRGVIFAHSAGNIPVPDISGRKNYRDALKSKDFSVGEYTFTNLGRISALFFSYPIFGEGKEVKGVLSVSYRLFDYDRILAKVPLPPGAVVWLSDLKGTRLYRYPTDQNAPVGGRVNP